MSQNNSRARPLRFDEAQQREIDRCLLRLADHVGAPLVMLADVSGRLVLYRGRLPAVKSTGLAALAAASFAAGNEMAGFLGLPEKFEQQLHEGKAANLYSLAVGPDLLLILAFKRQTMLGMVRLFAQQAQHELLEVAKSARRASTTSDRQLDDGFEQEVRKQLDDLFPAEDAEVG